VGNCKFCGQSNLDDAKFCANCGNELGDNCPNCGADLPGEVTFCPSCGTNLTTSQTQERRFVTVLFVDLVGFTADSDQADPEDVHSRLVPYHARVRREIEGFGGSVEKLIGDGVMAVFGVPTAHEDDPERAVRAGLRILEGVEELNEQNEKLSFAVRIGINSGIAMVTTGGQGERIVGDVVNTASRLESIAPVGAVVVGEATHRATELMIDYQELDAVEVKGKADPLPIWRAIEPRGRYGIDAAVRTNTPFLGRESEMKLMADTFRRVVDDGVLQLVTIAAPPGVGKSRLVNEFWQWADDQPDIVWWRQGRCLPYGEGISFWALGEIVKGQAGIRESDDASTATEKLRIALEAICDDPADRTWMLTQLSPLVGAESDAETGDRAEAFAAWRRFLEDLAANQPLVMVIEDLHWVDDPFIEFLDDLMVWSSDSPIMVVSTARPELYESHPAWGGGQRNSTTITLSPLTDEEIAQLIAAHLDRAVLPAETQQSLLERAEGNPLYAEEFIRMLTDRGMIDEHGVLDAESTATLPVPETVHGLIGSRLDLLSEAERHAIEDAAVVGKVFWEGSINALGSHDDVRTSLRGLVAREWIRPIRKSSVEGETEYAFWHALTRDVAYGRIPRRARAEKHQLIANWIESAAGERASDHAELLAYHFESALEIAQAAGVEDVETLREETKRTLVMAGDRSAVLDPARAASYFQRALDLYGDSDPEAASLLIKLGSATGDLGSETFEIRPLDRFREAAVLAREAGDSLVAARALKNVHVAEWFLRGTGAGSQSLDEAITLLETLPPSEELAELYISMSGHQMMSGNTPEQLLWAEKAISVYDQIGVTAPKGYTFRGIARFDMSDIDGGLADLEKANEIAIHSQIPNRVQMSTAVNLAGQIWISRGPAASKTIYEDAIARLSPRGTDTSWAQAELMWLNYDLGEWDAVLDSADTLIERWQGEESQFIPWAQSYKAKVLAWRGDVVQAADLVEKYLPAVRRIEDLQLLAPGLIIAARIEFDRGSHSAARELLDEWDGLTKGKTAGYRTFALAEVVRILVAIGEIEKAEEWLADSRGGAWRHEISRDTATAIIAEAHGEHDEALLGYQATATEWENYGFKQESAFSLLSAGKMLHILGDEAGSQEHTESARRLFDELGMPPEHEGMSDQAAAL
jgi:class 3 adenylate cyclase/tetratricopeptide (TPR) repeat protein